MCPQEAEGLPLSRVKGWLLGVLERTHDLDQRAHTIKSNSLLPVWEVMPWVCEGRKAKMSVGSEEGAPPPEAAFVGAEEPQ